MAAPTFSFVSATSSDIKINISNPDSYYIYIFIRPTRTSEGVGTWIGQASGEVSFEDYFLQLAKGTSYTFNIAYNASAPSSFQGWGTGISRSTSGSATVPSASVNKKEIGDTFAKVRLSNSSMYWLRFQVIDLTTGAAVYDSREYGNPDSAAKDISGLTEGTEYQVRIFYWEIEGLSSSAREVTVACTFTTNGGVVVPSYSFAVSAEQIDVQITGNTDRLYIYFEIYTEDGIDVDAFWSSANSVSLTGSFTGLTPNTTYRVRVSYGKTKGTVDGVIVHTTVKTKKEAAFRAYILSSSRKWEPYDAYIRTSAKVWVKYDPKLMRL